MKKTLLTIIILFFYFLSIQAQTFYYCDENKDIHLYDLATCHDSIVIDVQATGITYHDITFAPDGNLYAVRIGELYRINMMTGIATLVNDWCPGFTCSTRALICDAAGNIYAAGNDLFIYNVYTGYSMNLGTFPAGISAAGDLTFHNGKLYMAAFDNEIVEVDTITPGNSQAVFTMNTNTSEIVGITTFFVSCDSSLTIGSTQFGELFEIDIEDQTVNLLPCTTDTLFTNGLATPQEFLASECDFSIDLDGDDSSGNVDDGFFYASCAMPAPIVDTDMVLVSGYVIDSIVISNATQLDGANEYFTAGGALGISVTGENTNHLVLNNGGTATPPDFVEALQSVLFHNDAAMPTYGQNNIYVTVWSSAGDSLTVQSVNYYYPFTFSLGSDTTLCCNSPLYLTHNIPVIGFNLTTEWQDGSTAVSFEVTSPGIYYLHAIADYGLGCEWTDTVVVGFADPIFVQEPFTLCEGDVFTLNNEDFFTDTLLCMTYASADGCDSTYCADVRFLPAVQVYLDTTICGGNTVSLAGEVFGTTGIYTVSAANANGCDTTFQLDLSVLPNPPFVIDTTICDGAIVTIGNHSYSMAGDYIDTLTNMAGCDSIVQLALQVAQPSAENIIATICEGDTFMVGNIPFGTEGIHEVLLTNQNGCDSIVTLTLTVHPDVLIVLDTFVCEGDSIIYGNQALSQPGTYEFQVSALPFCDTVLRINLFALPLPSVAILQENAGCAASASTLLAEPPAGMFVWSNGTVGNAITVAQSGTYSVTMVDGNGCSATAFTDVLLTETLSGEVLAQPPLCAGGTDGWIEIIGTDGGAGTYSYSINSGLPDPDPFFDQLPSGDFTVTVMDGSGCVWDTLIQLTTAASFQINAGADQFVTAGSQVTLEATSASSIDSIWWLPTDYLTCPTCPVTISYPLKSIEYHVIAIDKNGCEATSSVFVGVNEEVNIFAPTAFSPNDDGFNDRFTLFAGNGVESIDSLMVFDRWGGMVFQVDELSPGDFANGWDGKQRGKPVSAGVYVWLATAHLQNGEIRQISGEIVLVR